MWDKDTIILKQLSSTHTKLDKILNFLIAFQKTEAKAMAQFDDQIVALTANVAAVKTIEDSAVTLINGIPAMIAAAVAQAQAAGATPAQLQALTDLGAALTANAAPLAAAVSANVTP